MDDMFLPILAYNDLENNEAVPGPSSSDRCTSKPNTESTYDNDALKLIKQGTHAASGSATEASSNAAVLAERSSLSAAPATAARFTPNPNPLVRDGCNPVAVNPTGPSAGSPPAGQPPEHSGSPATGEAAAAHISSSRNAGSSPRSSVSDCTASDATGGRPADGPAPRDFLSRSSPAPPTRSATAKNAPALAAGGDHSEQKVARGGDGDEEEEELPPPDSMDDFEARRRRAVFTAMLLLLEHGARDPDHLSHLVAPMSGEELQQVAEERALAGRCGNPLCSATHSICRPTPRRRWDPEVGFMEPPPPSHFCSAACELLIESYAAQLGDPLERLQPGVRELLSVSHAPRRPGMEDVAAQGGGVATMMTEVRERDPAATAAAAVAAGRELDKRAAEAASGNGSSSGGGSGSAGSHIAVEGYVPGAGKRRPPLPPAAAAVASTVAAAAPRHETGETDAAAGAPSGRPLPQLSGGGAPPALKPSLRKQSSLKVSGSGSETDSAAGSQGCGGVAASASRELEREKEREREQKRVTFGPKIEYQMPADPSRRASSAPSRGALPRSAAADQPVLLFDVEDEEDDSGGGAADGGGSGGQPGRRVRLTRQQGPAAGPRGTLRVAEASQVVEAIVGQAVVEAGAAAAGLTDEELAASMREKGPPGGATPRAMRLWFPPSAGGTGVGRRTGSGTTVTTKTRRPHDAPQLTVAAPAPSAPPPLPPQHQQVRGSEETAADPGPAEATPAATGPADAADGAQPTISGAAAAASDAGTAGAAASTAAGGSSSLSAPEAAVRASPAESTSEMATDRSQEGESRGTQAVGAARPDGSRPTGLPADAQSSSGRQVPGLRRFLPSVPQQRRKVVFLDEAPPGSQGQGQGAQAQAQAAGQRRSGAVRGQDADAGEGLGQGQGQGQQRKLVGTGEHAATEQPGPGGRPEEKEEEAEVPPEPQTGTAAGPAAPAPAPAPAEAGGVTAHPLEGPSFGDSSSSSGPGPGPARAGAGDSDVSSSSAAGSAAVEEKEGPLVEPPERSERGADAAPSSSTSSTSSRGAPRDPDSGVDSSKPPGTGSQLGCGAPALRNPGQALTDPWAPWSETPPAAAAAKVHVVHIRSDRRPPGRGVPIPPENQPYFPEDEDEEDEAARYDERLVHDDRDADEMADDLYAGTLAGADAEDDAAEDKEEEEEEGGTKVRGKLQARRRSGGAGPRKDVGCETACKGAEQGRGGLSGGAAQGKCAAAAATAAAGTGAATNGSGHAAGSLWKARRREQQHQHQQSERKDSGQWRHPADNTDQELRLQPPEPQPQQHQGGQEPGQPPPCTPAHPHGSQHPDPLLRGAEGAGAAPAPSSCQPASADAAQDTSSSSRELKAAGDKPGSGPRCIAAGLGPPRAPAAAAQRPSPQPSAAAGGRSGEGGMRGPGAGAVEGSGGGVAAAVNEDDGEADADEVPSLEPWMLRDELDSLSGGDDDDEGASSASGDDYNYKSMLPYFHRTTQHYRMVLSPYNQVQAALVGWVNNRTVSFVVGVGLGPLMDPGPVLADAAYAEEGDGGVPDLTALQARGVLLQLLSAPVRECCSQLAVRVPQSDVDRKLTALASTFRLSGPVPSLKQPQWMLMALALLHALSRHHIPALRTSLCAPLPSASSPGAGDSGGGVSVDVDGGDALPPPPLRAGGVLHPHPRLVGLLDRIGFDVHYLSSLVDLLVSPEF